MIELASTALSKLRRALRITSSGGSQQTLLDDGLLNQSLNANGILSRSLTPLADGIGWGALQVALAGAGTDDATIDPYNPGAGFVDAGWPEHVPDGSDVYMLAVSASYVGAGANFDHAHVRLVGDFDTQGWGIDESGAACLIRTGTMGIAPFIVAEWATASSLAGLTLLAEAAPNLAIARRPFLRIPRRMLIRFAATSSGAITVRAFILLALLPTGLGSDAHP